MPLITLHTRLMTILEAARTLKAEALNKAQQLSLREQTFGTLTLLHGRCQQLIEEVCDPYAEDEQLDQYAAQQFGDPDFGLLLKLTGIKQLLQVVQASVRVVIAPYTPEQQHNGTSVLVDGEVVLTPRYTPEMTSTVAYYLQLIHDNIPE